MRKEYTQLISILVCATQGIDQKRIEGYETWNWKGILHLAYRHKVENMIYYAIPELDKLPEQAKKLIVEFKDKGVRREVMQQIEVEKLQQFLNEQSVPFSVLKGWVLKKLYPSPDMRAMTDVDVLYDEQYFEQVDAFMKEKCYKVENYGKVHDVYTKKPLVVIELHKRMFSERVRGYEYYKEFWDLFTIYKEDKTEVEMSDEEFYIYHIVHMAKHFAGTGTGIRSFLDIKMYLNSKDLDWEYIKIKLSELGLLKFERQVIKLCEVWYENKQYDPEMEVLAEYIIEGSIYGKITNEGENKLAEKSKKGFFDKLAWVIKRMFPSSASMEEKEVSDNIIAWLLPYYWIKWWLKMIIFRRKKLQQRLTIFKTDSKEFENRRKMLDSLGL